MLRAKATPRARPIVPSEQPMAPPPGYRQYGGRLLPESPTDARYPRRASVGENDATIQRWYPMADWLLGFRIHCSRTPLI